MIKPTVLLILLLTVSGSLFLSRFPATLVKYSNSSGYHTFIMAAFAGIFFFVISYILTTLTAATAFAQNVGRDFSEFVSILLPALSADASSLNLISVSILSMLLAYFSPIIIIMFLTKVLKKDPILEAWEQDARQKDTPEFTSLFFNAVKLEMPIAFTLDNRKVYVGYVIDFSTQGNDFLVLPLVSGYRDKDTLDFKRVINYEKVIQSIVNGELKEFSPHERREYLTKKFAISLAYREVVHANIHDMRYYNDFMKHRFDQESIGPTEVCCDDSPANSDAKIKIKQRVRVRAGI